MHRPLFLRIASAIEAHDSYFSLRRNSAGVPGLHPYQKLTSVFRILAYGIAADLTDEYCRLAKSTALENLRRFVHAVIEVFGPEYLRQPTAADTCNWRAMGVSRYARKHQLHALEVKKIVLRSVCMATASRMI